MSTSIRKEHAAYLFRLKLVPCDKGGSSWFLRNVSSHVQTSQYCILWDCSCTVHCHQNLSWQCTN